MVVSHLESKDLATCVRVSKSWRDIVLPIRWRFIKVLQKSSANESAPEWLGPRPDDMYRHCDLIHELTFIHVFNGFDKHRYPNLRKLTIDFRDPNKRSIVSDDSRESVSLDLTEMFPLLVELNLMVVVVTPITWMTLAAHNHIKALWLINIKVEAAEVPMLWKACGNLEVLKMGSVTVQQSGNIQPDLVFHKLHTLHLIWVWGMHATAQMDLMLRCHGLENVMCHSYSGDFEKQRTFINQPLHWPRLKELCFDFTIQDGEMTSILKGIGNGFGGIVKLVVDGAPLKAQAFRALGLHFSTLVDLHLSGCQSTASPAIQDILCGCPKLESLAIASIFARDIVKGGPWVCQQLRRLFICIMVEESEEDLQPLVFERLSTLTRLQHLSMIPPPMDADGVNVLEFRLDCGMGKLTSLQQLASLYFEAENLEWPIEYYGTPYYPQLGMNEVAWMAEHWKLHSIMGVLNSDQQIEAEVKDAIFESFGIRVI